MTCGGPGTGRPPMPPAATIPGHRQPCRTRCGRGTPQPSREPPVVAARAAAGLLADNFLDLAHLPFVRAATFGAEAPVVPPLEVRGDGWSFMAGSEHELLNREDPGVAAGTRPLRQRRRVTCRVSGPFHLVVRPDFLDAGGTNVIGFFLQPETADQCRI